MVIITENQLLDAIENYFTKHGFTLISMAKNNEKGIDMELLKNGVTLLIEAKGSIGNKYDTDPSIKPFARSLVREYVRKQITKLMEREEKNGGNNTYFIAAWPETPLFRNEVNKKAKALAKLGYLHIWLQENMTVKIEGPGAEKLIELLDE
ncbi:hypothetical protein MKZ01_06515 [Lysinibacillus endophyticus]|uniref:hypothetical protein n=1 Tax=Ureibacillus endophyticus TaxID=1978490 RepID=UPI003134760C